jgi:hypothetical protein
LISAAALLLPVITSVCSQLSSLSISISINY